MHGDTLTRKKIRRSERQRLYFSDMMFEISTGHSNRAASVCQPGRDKGQEIRDLGSFTYKQCL